VMLFCSSNSTRDLVLRIELSWYANCVILQPSRFRFNVLSWIKKFSWNNPTYVHKRKEKETPLAFKKKQIIFSAQLFDSRYGEKEPKEFKKIIIERNSQIK
jgi:hypothetical protein